MSFADIQSMKALNQLSKLSYITNKTKNYYNSSTSVSNMYLNYLNGSSFASSGYFVSDYIAVTPNTQYTLTPTYSDSRIAFYDTNKNFLSSIHDYLFTWFVTPPNTAYIRFSSQTGLQNSSVLMPDVRYNTIYTLKDAWAAWMRGDKFPIAFYGDSTIDGVGTTGYVANSLGNASTSPNTFCAKLQPALQTATGNNNLAIYNAGFSGQTADWGLTNIIYEFAGGSVYKDVKMLGIGFGINDRLEVTNDGNFRDNFKGSIKGIINWCYANGIQPFLLTTQAILEPGVETDQTSYPLRTSEHINSVTNSIKRDLAWEYGLELIDVNKFTENYLIYSSVPANSIIPGRLHFADPGHQYESDMFFYHLCPRTIYVNGYTQIDYSRQTISNSIPEDWLTMPSSPTDSFKVYVNYTKSDSNDTKIFTAYVFIDTKNQKLNLTAYTNSASPSTHVQINGVNHALTGTSTNLGALDLGLYRLDVFTGASTSVDFKGFILQ